MGIREDVTAQLTGPGGPFEIVVEEVFGERLPVLKSRPHSLRELLSDSVSHGDKEYLVHEERRITYAEHIQLVASTARGLTERYGIGKGDVVAILAANSPDWPLFFWASVSLGAVVASMNGWWSRDEIEYALEQTSPKLLVGDRRRLERLKGSDLDVPILELESGRDALFSHAPDADLPDVEIDEDDPAVILFTSGTTGRPKGAVGTHRGIIGFCQVNIVGGAISTLTAAQEGTAPPRDPNPPAQEISLVTAPMFHLSGLYANIVMQLQLGAKLVTRSGKFDPADVLRLMETEHVTMWSALGAMGPRVATHPDIAKRDLSSMRNIGFGGAPASPAVQELLRKAFPSAAQNVGIGYGSSETVAVPASIRGPEYKLHPESAGRILPMHEIEIRSEGGQALPDGQEGEIHVRSAYLMREYWNDPEATAKSIGPGRWLATGDIGRVEEGLLYINSRARDMILRSAENVYPVEIEYRLDGHPDVRESAVVGVEHPELGQEVKAIVVPEPDASLEPEKLAAWCAETLAGFKVPSLWEIRSQPLPRNASGKILKNVLTGDAEINQIED
ncbi:MAG: class I adenylate-forming enzyme family protein [Myxococcota bacterium]